MAVRPSAARAPLPWVRPQPPDLVAAAACLLLGLLAVRYELVPFLSGVDLGVHEFGHLVTGWLPEVLTAVAGSVFQVVAPVGLAAYFGLVRRERRTAGVLLAWAGTSMWAVARYVADAPHEELPLFGGDIHDWAFLLGPEHCDCLSRAAPLAGVLRTAAVLLVATGLAVALNRRATGLDAR